MSLQTLDLFSGSAGTDLTQHVPDFGTWSKSSDSSEAGPILIDGIGGINAYNTRAVYFHSVVPASADYRVAFVVRIDPDKPNGTNRYAIGRNSGTSYHGVMAGIAQNGNWTLWQDLNPIASAAGPSPTTVTYYQCVLIFSGSKASLTVDGTEVIPPTTITLTDAGKIGLWFQDGDASNSKYSLQALRFDDGSSTAPTPTLTVTPSSATIPSGTQTASFVPILTNATGPVSVSKSGNGQVSPSSVTSGSAVTFEKPSGSSGSTTLTFSAPGVTPVVVTVSYTADVIGGPITVPVTDSRVYFSPYNWDSGGTGTLASNNVRGASTWARSNNPGAYLKTALTVGSGGGGSISLLLDTTSLQGVAPFGPRLAYSVDGGAFSFATLTYSASQVTLSLATGLPAGPHDLRVDFQGTITAGSGHDDVDRWVTPANAVRIVGLQINAGSTLAAPTVYPDTILFYGDSILECIRIYGGGSNPGDQDATAGFARMLGDALKCEIGIVGFGSQGYQYGGFGGVPNLPTAWSYYSAGRSRLLGGLLQPPPKYILDEHGTNGPTTSNNVQTQLGLYRAAAPDAWIFKATTFPYLGTAPITAGVAAYQAANPGDTKTKLLDTGGSQANARTTADGTHPNVLGHAGYAGDIAVKIGRVTGGGGSGFSLDDLRAELDDRGLTSEWSDHQRQAARWGPTNRQVQVPATQTSGRFDLYGDDGTTVEATQPYADDGQGNASVGAQT